MIWYFYTMDILFQEVLGYLERLKDCEFTTIVYNFEELKYDFEFSNEGLPWLNVVESAHQLNIWIWK